MEAGVSDAGFSGSNYTWCNNRQGRARIWKRFNRVLLNLEALQIGSSILVQHLSRDPPDHALLLMTAPTWLDNKPKPFRFLNVWTTKAGLLDVIHDSWSCPMSGQHLCVLAIKFHTIKQVLKGWSRESFGNIFRAVKEAERAVLEAEVAQEQDSARWLKDGDRNSKYFHAVVAERRSRAIIHRICDSNGEWVKAEEHISREAISFFQRLFTAEPCSSSSEFLDTIPKLVTDGDKTQLMEPPTMAEVKKVVFSMDGESAAGPDGFIGKFFTFVCDVVAEDVYKAILSFFCGAELPRSITATTIVLIPQVQCPQDFT
ncbi:uncharacterized protein LOC113782301 [Coffea eugenioides]|uniref:uncharacterized protein LOC113782301 n=1 Tax=Coffea eugenioides TaxID=49369 RepID=UPI000F6090F3|nr:uncharacterized protein LOC113782301 [Coffea eugenioides]